MKPFQVFNKNISLENIRLIYDTNIKHKSSVGIDGINIKSFEKKLNSEIEIIHRKVSNQTYNFSFYREKLISKGRNKLPRVISIPTIRDKIVLKILFKTLSEIFKNDISNELIHTTIDNTKRTIESKTYDSYIKIDIENFYPSINHKLLMKVIHKKTRKLEFTSLLQKSITQRTVSSSSSDLEKYTNDVGVPQGLSISNLLSSIYLIDFDNKHTNQEHYQYQRYVDDILILCHKKDVPTIFDTIKKDMKLLKLKIHDIGGSSQKTDYGLIQDRFYFLGYSFSNDLITVRNISIKKIENSIINIFSQYKYSRKKNIEHLYWKLNLKITGCKFEDRKYGWLFFFSQINDTTRLYQLDVFIKKLFNEFGLVYDEKKVKKFIRTYFEIIKNRIDTTYIPNFSTYTKDEKKHILRNVLDVSYVNDDNIDELFNNVIYKNIREMEKDIQSIS